MTTLIITFALLLLIIRSMANNIAIWVILRSFDIASNRTSHLSEDRHLVLILKVFEETTLIKDTVHYIAQQIEGLERVSAIIVGTAKERGNNNLNPTLELARCITNARHNFMVVEAPVEFTSHAGQNNYALEFIKSPPDKTWIFTLDIDSRFTQQGLCALMKEINQGTQIIQQSALFLTNFESLGFLQKAHALYQSRWTVAHEIKRIQLHNLTKLSIAHVVGHGLCINLSLLKDFGNFPLETMMEDINLGFYLVCAGQQIKALNVFELADNPASLIDGLRQEYVWSFGAMFYPLYLKHYINKFPDHWKQNYARLLFITGHGVITYIAWLFGSWILVYCIVLGLLGNLLAKVYIALYLFEFIQCAYYFWKSGYFSVLNLILAPLYGLIGALRRSIGADFAMLHLLSRRQIIKFKTSHSDIPKYR